MQKVRFCHVIDGSNQNPLLYNSIKSSDRNIFEYTVISLEPEGALQDQMAELGVRSFSLDYASRKQSVSVLLRLIKFFRKEKFQIVQTHLFDASLIGLTAARIARVPLTIFTGHHSHETPLHKRKLLNFVDGLSGRFLANHTIAPSRQMKEIFVRDLNVPSDKIAVAHHGFDLDDWRAKAQLNPRVREEFGLENKIVFGAVGRLFWVKNFENLINAFAEIADGREDIVLMIVGGGDATRMRIIAHELGIGDKVILTGPRKDIASVIDSFDVFVHSSFAESFGMVFIEAFALGTPIVTTSVGVAPEIIEDGINGFLAEGSDRSSLVAAMSKMLAARTRWREMGNKGKLISDGFDVKTTQQHCDQLYLTWLNVA